MLSCEFCEIFKNTFFTEHPRVTASVKTINSDEDQPKNIKQYIIIRNTQPNVIYKIGAV